MESGRWRRDGNKNRGRNKITMGIAMTTGIEMEIKIKKMKWE